jgi:hypothetical protein
MAGVGQGRPIGDDQAPVVGGLVTPMPRQRVQRLDQLRQDDAVIVQETVSAQDGGEAPGQFGQAQGMDAGDKGIAGM